MQSTSSPRDYPIRFDVEYPEEIARWHVFNWLLAIPQLIVIYLLGIVLQVMVVIAFFAILFTKKWPRGLFDFTVQIQRWTLNVIAYVLILRPEYPPFSGEPGEYPVAYVVEYDDNLSRLLIFVKWLLVIPHFVILTLLVIAALAIALVASFAIAFTGRFPRGMFDFLVGTMRWYQRAYGYGFLLFTDRYPPFGLK
jgi:small-conductance mechanosensitive channel